jgi:hypothetical protein
MVASRDICVLVCVCVCVIGPVLVLCGRDIWFLGGRDMCDIFGVLRFWYVNPLMDCVLTVLVC